MESKTLLQYNQAVQFWNLFPDYTNCKGIVGFKFSYPYDILDILFTSQKHSSSLDSIEKTYKSIYRLENLIQEGGDEFYLLANEDPIIKCGIEVCHIIDSGPDEEHSVPPNEIYGPNWNKRNPGMEFVKTEILLQLIKDWKEFLVQSSNYVLKNLKNEKIIGEITN